jgi:hypothetical protein
MTEIAIGREIVELWRFASGDKLRFNLRSVRVAMEPSGVVIGEATNGHMLMHSGSGKILAAAETKTIAMVPASLMKVIASGWRAGMSASLSATPDATTIERSDGVAVVVRAEYDGKFPDLAETLPASRGEGAPVRSFGVNLDLLGVIAKYLKRVRPGSDPRPMRLAVADDGYLPIVMDYDSDCLKLVAVVMPCRIES